MASAGASEKKILRMIDANFNRAKEGVRVSEDIARFVLDDKGLAGAFKKLRHDLSSILLSFPVSYSKLLGSRDSGRDVTRSLSIRDLKKVAWQDLMTSNLKRAQEAIRVLEECSKIISPKHAAKLSRLRFVSYELEKRSIQKF